MKINKKYLLFGLIFLSISPFLWVLFFDSKHLGGFIYSFANVAGLIGAVLFFWQMILGIRGVLYRFTTDYSLNIKVHTLIGIYGTLFVLLHPILIVFSYLESWFFILVPSAGSEQEFYISLGRIAFLLFILIWLTSAVLREKLKFRPWLYIHYLTYPMIFLVLVHANQIGSYIAKYPFIQAYWYALIAGFFLLVLYKILQVLNINKQKYEVKSVQEIPGDIFIYKFAPKSKKLLPKPGQFMYVKASFYGESHPFTVMEFKENGELTFGVRALGKYTKNLSAIKKSATVFLDGPYGEFTKEAQNTNPKVMIAGGIGITPFVEVVEQFSNNNTYLLYSNKKLEYAIHRDEFKKRLGDRYFDFVSQESKNGKNIVNSRITKESLPFDINKFVKNSTNFFVCGNKEFNNGIKKMLIEVGVPKKNIFYEDFGF